MSNIKPEYLMEPEDYRLWNQYQKAVKNRKRTSQGHWELNLKTEEEEAMEQQLFESVSKRAWTDVCLQLLKVHFTITLSLSVNHVVYVLLLDILVKLIDTLKYEKQFTNSCRL